MQIKCFIIKGWLPKLNTDTDKKIMANHRIYNKVPLLILVFSILSTGLNTFAHANKNIIDLSSAADLLSKEKYNEAIREYEYLLNNYKNNDNRLLFKYLTALCTVYELNGELVKAKSICARSLQLSIKIYGKNKFETASAYDDMALIYADLGKFDDPSLIAPIYANLFDNEGSDGLNLVWSRGRKNGSE